MCLEYPDQCPDYVVDSAQGNNIIGPVGLAVGRVEIHTSDGIVVTGPGEKNAVSSSELMRKKCVDDVTGELIPCKLRDDIIDAAQNPFVTGTLSSRLTKPAGRKAGVGPYPHCSRLHGSPSTCKQLAAQGSIFVDTANLRPGFSAGCSSNSTVNRPEHCWGVVNRGLKTRERIQGKKLLRTNRIFILIQMV